MTRDEILSKIKNGESLSKADLFKADLTRANLTGAKLAGAYLAEANLYGADLSGADLTVADLPGANLTGADLTGANLAGANLSGTNLTGAYLSRANLSRTDLAEANLYGANLYGANLYGAYLSGAKNIPNLVTKTTLIVPEDGAVTGWKKCMGGVLVKLEIADGVPRHNATGRKCRAQSAKVLEVIGSDVGVSLHQDGFRYVAGNTVTAQNYEPDRWQECAGGIHFFITRYEAEQWEG